MGCFMNQGGQKGFTLVELAIVLVVIGLVLGMAFKGRDLIDGAKVKNMQAQYSKVVAAFNIYYEKYGAFPGDGCVGALAGGATLCAGVRNGALDTADEATASLQILQNANILAAADINSVFGQSWSVSVSGAASANFAANTNYLTVGGVAANVADVRYVCQLDRLMDDGAPETGSVRSNAGNGAVVGAAQYNRSADCWAQSGQVSIGVRLLP